MRLGMSVTGVCQSLDKVEWLDEAYVTLRAFDSEWSKQRGWNPSIKLTSIKPSGTVSLLTGSSAGIHPIYAPYYLRRIRIASDHALVPYVEAHGYKTEFARKFDGTEDYTTRIIEVVCKANGLSAKDMTAIQQLELVKKLQTLWVDNSISVTVYFRDTELDTIKQWLQDNYETSIKAVSFLRHNDHGFDQAPYEEITQEQYESVLYVPLTSFNEYIELGDEECIAGFCPIR